MTNLEEAFINIGINAEKIMEREDDTDLNVQTVELPKCYNKSILNLDFSHFVGRIYSASGQFNAIITKKILNYIRNKRVFVFGLFPLILVLTGLYMCNAIQDPQVV